MTTFGEEVRGEREFRRPAMSQSNLAALADTDQSTISDIETGKKTFGNGLGGALARRVAKALGGRVMGYGAKIHLLMPPAPAENEPKGTS